MNVESLVSNPIMKNLLLGQLKKLVKENNVKAIVITPDAEGELNFAVYDADVKILTGEQYQQTLSTIKALTEKAKTNE